MILISHRGNINGRNVENENSPIYIDKAIEKKYFVEVDIWCIGELLFLGHDEPKYEVGIGWLLDRRFNLILHCKNVSALYKLKYLCICFYHNNDNCVLMSNTNWIWTYPGKDLTLDSIAVLPEYTNEWDSVDFKTECAGVCSDYIEKYITEDL